MLLFMVLCFNTLSTRRRSEGRFPFHADGLRCDHAALCRDALGDKGTTQEIPLKCEDLRQWMMKNPLDPAAWCVCSSPDAAEATRTLHPALTVLPMKTRSLASCAGEGFAQCSVTNRLPIFRTREEAASLPLSKVPLGARPLHPSSNPAL